MNDLLFTSHDWAALGRFFFWSTALSLAMRSLARGFGPLVMVYSPNLHRFLALFGNGLLTLISDGQGFVEMMRPKPNDPPKPPTPPVVGAMLLALATAVASCKSPYPVDGCLPREQRCANNQAQVCSGSRRWTSSGPACADGLTCCWTPSAFASHLVTACVTPQLCTDGGK